MAAPSPLVTIGLPFFDEQRFLAAAVRSILGQSFTDFELLLVDDGSTDGSLAVARTFDDPRITIRSDGQRRHLPARLNEIARAARGRFIARMDADDVAHPERIARQLALFDCDARCDAVGTWIGLVDEDERVFAVVEAAAPATPRVALEHGLLPHATLISRREWSLANPYDESMAHAEDRELWCRTFSSTRFAIVPEPLYAVRVLAHDRDFLAKYVNAQRAARRLFLRYGPKTVGLGGTARAWVTSHGKGLVMRAAAALGRTSVFTQRRGRSPTKIEAATVRCAIDASRQ